MLRPNVFSHFSYFGVNGFGEIKHDLAKPINYLLLFLLCLWHFPLGAAEEASTLPALESGKVVLSWEELKKLLAEIDTLKRAQVEATKKPEETVPVAYAITEAHFNGMVKDTSARLEATFAVQVLQKGWVVIPFFANNELGIEELAISPLTDKSTATSETELAQFVRYPEGYALVIKGPQALAVQMTLHVPVKTEELTHTLSFLPPRSVINSFVLQIPEKNVQVLHSPANTQLTTKDNFTTLAMVLSEGDALKLSWQVEKDSSISRQSLATLQALASLDKTALSVFSTLTLQHVTALDQVVFQLPLAVEILSVTSQDIEQWSSEKSDQAQLIKIAGTAHTPLKIDISYRLQLAELPATAAIPLPSVIGVDKLEGFLGVEVLGNLEVTANTVTNGAAIPAKNLPKTLWQRAASPLLYGYQFHLNTFTASLEVKSYQEIQTVVANVDLVDCVTHRTLEGKSITRILYLIRNNDRQFLTLTLPEHSHIWQAFLNGAPVNPAQKDSGEILIPMKKSTAQGQEWQSFALELGYITEVDKLSLKGDIVNQLPAIDLPISYLQWSLYLPEYYEYSRFEGPLKQVDNFSDLPSGLSLAKAQIDIPTQGQVFRFEKHLIVDERPYMRGQYGQFLGGDILLSLHPTDLFEQKLDYAPTATPATGESDSLENYERQVIPNRALK